MVLISAGSQIKPSVQQSPIKAFFFSASLLQTDLINVTEFPLPYPSKFKDAWDDVSVKMPCSEKNLFPVETEVCDSISSSLCMSWRNTTGNVLFAFSFSRSKLSFRFVL